jgi:hypothetical protein
MKAITLRGIDEELEAALKNAAKENGESVNKTLLRLLRGALDLDKPKLYREYHDIDHLAGTWTEADAEEFLNTQEGFRQVDEDLWK